MSETGIILDCQHQRLTICKIIQMYVYFQHMRWELSDLAPSPRVYLILLY